MKGLLRVHLGLCLVIPIVAGCASAPEFRPFSPDPQSVEQGRVRDTLVSLLHTAGRDPMGCSFFFFDSRNLGAVPLGNCMFAATTGLASTRNERLLGGMLARSVAVEVLGWKDKEQTTLAAFASRPRSSSQLEEAERKAAEILTRAGDPDPAGTLRYAATKFRNGGVVEPWPVRGDEAMYGRLLHDKVMAAVVPLVPGTERPTYALGQQWSRSDGDYRITRMDRDAYVFASGPDQEIHLTQDLMIRAAKRGDWATAFESLPHVWPLVVGKWGTTYGRWQVSSEPRSVSVEYLWRIEAYEDIQVPAGTFKAFRIALEWESREPDAGFGRKRLVSWYAPAVRQVVKAEFTDAGPLNFHVVTVDRPATLSPASPPARAPEGRR